MGKSLRRKDAEAQTNSPKPVLNRNVPAPKINIWIYAVLFLVTVGVYFQTAHFDFVNYDDPDYISGNAHVRQGVTADGIVWAFTSGEGANWFPVTRLSEMLDAQLFGMDSGWSHLINVLWHALAAMLLFAFLYRATVTLWPSAFVAFVFALHPLHVESVAWVTERKDVLSAFFWFLALWLYVRYTRQPGTGRYLLALGAFCLGLMSKPMIVTLPLLLLLLDIWPLKRGAWRIREKLPFFALSIVSAVITYAVQTGAGAAEVLQVPLGLRLENAVVSYAAYLAGTFAPFGLAVFYPYPPAISVAEFLGAALLLAGISAFVWKQFSARPYLAMGWLWYLVTLLPVIGLIQVGAQARADRYTYVPMVGLTVMLAWGGAAVTQRWPQARIAVAALAIAFCAACLALTWVQVGYWRNSATLFQHAVDVTRANYVAEHNLGTALMEEPGRLPDAIHHLETAVQLRPDSARAHSDLGSALSKLPDRLPQVIAEYQLAVRNSPGSAIPHFNLGNALEAAGRLAEALAEWNTAVTLDASYGPRLRQPMAEAHNNLGGHLAASPERLPEAIAHFQAAVKLAPDYADAHYNLGVALSNAGRIAEAIPELEIAYRLHPDPQLREGIDRLKSGR